MVVDSHDDVVQPRPLLARTRWIDLCGPWLFAYDDAACGMDEGWEERTDPYTRTIIVPFPPSAIGCRSDGDA